MVGYNPEPINGQLPLTSTEYSEAGLASGIFTRVIIQPLDVLKIRFQLQEEPIRGKKSGKYKGVAQSIVLISKEEGVRAFWKGHIPAQGLSATYGLVQFSSFEWLSREAGKLIPSDDSTVRSTSDFVCGAISGCFAMTAAMPLDVIRTRLVAQKSGTKVYNGTLHAMQYILKKEGIPGYFRGWVPSVAQIAPFTGLQFALYNCFMDLWPFEAHDSSAALFSGAMAGTLAKTVLYPLDMVRHRLQMNGFERSGFGKSSNYSQGLIKTILMVVKNEGWYGLFKGLWPSQIKAAANSGCFIVSIHALALTLSKLVFGVASDKTSSLKLFLGGCVVCAASSLCLAFSSSINQICGVMLMIGCVQGAGWVPATKLISSWFDKNSYATMFSILGCGSTLAGLLLPILKQYYWRTTEFNSGWMMVFFILICHFLIRENGKKEETSKKKTSEWKQLMKSSIIWNISLLYFFSMEIRTICETWIPLYLNDYKPSISNRFQFLYELGGIIGTMSSGLIIDKISLIYGVDQSRKRSGIVFSIMMMIFAISIIKFKEYASFLGFITGFFVNGSINIWCLIGSQAGNSEIAGTCSAFINFIATSGSIFAGSPLARLIANFGYQILEKLFLTQILIIVGLASFKIPLRLMKDEKKD